MKYSISEKDNVLFITEYDNTYASGKTINLKEISVEQLIKLHGIIQRELLLRNIESSFEIFNKRLDF